MTRKIYYTSDSHFSHANIIKFTNRPFSTEREMNTKMLGELRAVEEAGARIIHGGDIGMAIRFLHETYGPIFQRPEDHILIAGNHDRVRRPDLREEMSKNFGTIVGDEKSWLTNNIVVMDVLETREVRVMVSHNPQENIPDWIDYNVYGHVHNNLDHSMDWHITNYGRPWVEWLATSPKHLNACVELTEFKPVWLADLIDINHAFQHKLQEQLRSKAA